MNKTQIDWVRNPDGSRGSTWNPLVGCTKGCSHCYARRIATTRLAHRCVQCGIFTPHLHEERLSQPLDRKKPATIFVGSMGDMWDDLVRPYWRKQVWDIIRQTPQHTYLALTQQPQNVCWCSDMPNLWTGTTVTNAQNVWHLDTLYSDWQYFQRDRYAVRPKIFVSFEPLLGPISLPDCFGDFDWIIIGALTGPQARQPEVKWIRQLLEAANDHSIPVWVKGNLDWPEELGSKPQELPYLSKQAGQLFQLSPAFPEPSYETIQ